jgi:hypothetical protein
VSHDPGYSDEPFVGYLFKGPPEHRKRLWFLDRHVATLILIGRNERPIMGRWTIPDKDRLRHRDIFLEAIPNGQTYGVVLPDTHLRYEHQGRSAVWRLTATTIPRDPLDAQRGMGITSFGRDDDVWRLGLWPD